MVLFAIRQQSLDREVEWEAAAELDQTDCGSGRAQLPGRGNAASDHQGFGGRAQTANWEDWAGDVSTRQYGACATLRMNKMKKAPGVAYAGLFDESLFDESWKLP